MSARVSNQQLDTLLDTIADLILSKAKSIEEAAEIVKNTKTSKDKASKDKVSN